MRLEALLLWGRWFPGAQMNDSVASQASWAAEAPIVDVVLHSPTRAGDLPEGGPSGVSLVIPAWNEEFRLAATLERYTRFLESYGAPYEVIVVADGVTDRTVEIAMAFAGRGVKVLSFDHKLGKGGAILKGFRRSAFDIVGFMDADAPITPVNLAYLLSELTSSDAAIASRWVRRSTSGKRQSFARVMFSRGWNMLTRTILGLELRDTQCGAKFFRQEALRRVINQVTLTNWAFDAALLFHLKRAGYHISEVPVNWTDDPASKMRLERAVPAMLLSLIGIRMMSVPRLNGVAQHWANRLYRYLR